MKATCPNCGEELLGAVNTCWRCGKQVAAVADAPPTTTGVDFVMADAPPGESLDASVVDVSAVDASVVDAELSESSNDDVETGSTVSADSTDATTAVGDASAPAARRDAQSVATPPVSPSAHDRTPSLGSAPRRATSAPGSTTPLPPQNAARARDIPQPTHYARYAAATGGAVGAIVLSVMSLAFAYFTIGAMFTALLGIAMGAWGIQSNHRALAITAMALCCLAVVLSACFGAVNLYTEINGHSPFASPPITPPEQF
ncbi:MAG: hypothetical protein RIC55_00525 [Pirellulaceae bacterium]